MITIDFKIRYKDAFIAYEELLVKLKNKEFKEELLKDNRRGLYGSLSISFYNHLLVISTEMVWSLLFRVHCSAIEALLNGYQEFGMNFEECELCTMTFDYIDAEDTGVRIRLNGTKDYCNDKGNFLYYSHHNYLEQEIILHKWEYMEKLLSCANRFIMYREVLNLSDDPHLELWKNKVAELDIKLADTRTDR